VPLRKINWIIIVCVLVSLLAWFWKFDLIIEYLAFSGDNLLKGRLWTLVTALFIHADPLHLFGNMLFLFVFGNTLEKDLKATKTLGAFFFGGILSFLLSTFFYDSSTPLIGASAAIFTLTSIVMLVNPLKFSFLFLMPQGLVAIIYFAYNVVAVYSGSQGNIAYISHVIGFVIGMPFGIAWSQKWVRNLLITVALFLLYLIVIFLLLPMILGGASYTFFL
jgi:membrane associated rhomboid family serine protease